MDGAQSERLPDRAAESDAAAPGASSNHVASGILGITARARAASFALDIAPVARLEKCIADPRAFVRDVNYRYAVLIQRRQPAERHVLRAAPRAVESLDWFNNPPPTRTHLACPARQGSGELYRAA